MIYSQYRYARKKFFPLHTCYLCCRYYNCAKGQCLQTLVVYVADIIAVLKGNAYGHGSVELAKHLQSLGITHFAVASPWEGIELRQAGIQSYIQVFGKS